MKVHIGNEIARIQKLRGISNEEMAQYIHTSVRNVHHIKNKEDITTSQLLSLCELLNFNFFSLFQPVIIDPVIGFNQQSQDPEKKEKILTVNFELKYPLSRADELGKFMKHVNAIGNKMGFELI